jgi:hypothetical protein
MLGKSQEASVVLGDGWTSQDSANLGRRPPCRVGRHLLVCLAILAFDRTAGL